MSKKQTKDSKYGLKSDIPLRDDSSVSENTKKVSTSVDDNFRLAQSVVKDKEGELGESLERLPSFIKGADGGTSQIDHDIKGEDKDEELTISNTMSLPTSRVTKFDSQLSNPSFIVEEGKNEALFKPGQYESKTWLVVIIFIILILIALVFGAGFLVYL